jgi:hypothetical protein
MQNEIAGGIAGNANGDGGGVEVFISVAKNSRDVVVNRAGKRIRFFREGFRAGFVMGAVRCVAENKQAVCAYEAECWAVLRAEIRQHKMEVSIERASIMAELMDERLSSEKARIVSRLPLERRIEILDRIREKDESFEEAVANSAHLEKQNASNGEASAKAAVDATTTDTTTSPPLHLTIQCRFSTCARCAGRRNRRGRKQPDAAICTLRSGAETP